MSIANALKRAAAVQQTCIPVYFRSGGRKHFRTLLELVEILHYVIGRSESLYDKKVPNEFVPRKKEFLTEMGKVAKTATLHDVINNMEKSGRHSFPWIGATRDDRPSMLQGAEMISDGFPRIAYIDESTGELVGTLSEQDLIALVHHTPSLLGDQQHATLVSRQTVVERAHAIRSDVCVIDVMKVIHDNTVECAVTENGQHEFYALFGVQDVKGITAHEFPQLNKPLRKFMTRNRGSGSEAVGNNTVTRNDTIEDVIHSLYFNKASEVTLVDANNHAVGIVTFNALLRDLLGLRPRKILGGEDTSSDDVTAMSGIKNVQRHGSHATPPGKTPKAARAAPRITATDAAGLSSSGYYSVDSADTLTDSDTKDAVAEAERSSYSKERARRRKPSSSSSSTECVSRTEILEASSNSNTDVMVSKKTLAKLISKAEDK